MKRLITLAAVALGSGCVVSSQGPPIGTGTVTFYWKFVNSQGQTYGDYSAANTGCAAAGVDQVRVTIFEAGGNFVQTFNCVQASNGVPGVTVLDFLPGSYPWTLDGLRGGLTVYADSGTATVTSSFPDAVANGVLGASYGDLNVSYTLPVGATCAGLSEIAFRLYTDTVPPFLEYSSDFNALVPCNQGVFVVPSLAPGSYFFHFIAAIDSLGTSHYQVCNQTFPHLNQLEQITYDLQPTVAACP